MHSGDGLDRARVARALAEQRRDNDGGNN